MEKKCIQIKKPQQHVMCSLSPDDVHGESQGLLHTVGLTLPRQTGILPLIMGAEAHSSAQMLRFFSTT